MKVIAKSCAKKVAKSITQGALLNQTTLVERNADIVEAGGYVTISTGAPNLAIGPTRTFFNRQNIVLIRQNGQITKVRFYLGNAKLPSTLKVDIWRKDGATWDRIYRSEELISLCIANKINDIPVTPILVKDGDYLALSGDTGSNVFTAVAGYGSGSFHYQTEASINTTDYDWTAQPSLSGYLLPIKSYQQAPMIVGVGDSIMAGHPGHYSGVESSVNVNVPANSILGQLAIIDTNYVYQNMGIGSQTSTQISARFAADVVALKPKITLINGGVNDIAVGSITKSTFLSNYTSMLNACVTAGIIPVVCKIIPWTNGSTAQMRIRDEWNADLAALVATYTGAICIDFDAALGQYDPTGDPGNLWNIKTAYNADGVHLNIAGYTAMALKIDEEIKKLYRFI